MNCPYLDSGSSALFHEEAGSVCTSLCSISIHGNNNFCIKCPFFRFSRKWDKRLPKKMRLTH